MTSQASYRPGAAHVQATVLAQGDCHSKSQRRQTASALLADHLVGYVSEKAAEATASNDDCHRTCAKWSSVGQ